MTRGNTTVRDDAKRSLVGALILTFSTIGVFVFVASRAWISEDALITCRVIENFVNGYGLRWNIDERVQVYTHPLWLFVNAATYAITREVPYTLTAVSLVFSVAAYLVVARRLSGRPVLLLVGLFTPFVVSRSIVLYGTSGFESPVAYFLFAVYAICLLPKDDSRPPCWGCLGLCVALAGLNRLDHMLLYVPSLAYVCIANWRRVKWGHVLLGMTPLVLWLVFSLLYYGSPFPNTARAKLCPSIPASHYVREGVLYTAHLIRWDRASAPILVLALATGSSALVRLFSKQEDARAGRIAALSVGVFLYGAYILRIGGGFLSGRFWAVPLFASVLVIVFGIGDLLAQLKALRTRTTAAVVGGVMVILFAVYAVAFELKSIKARVPMQDRSLASLYLKTDLTWGMTEIAEAWRAKGLRLRHEARQTPGRYVTVSPVIGFMGFAAGPEVTFIDPHALADPLLARLPLETSDRWRPGHFRRPVPAGYFRARQTGLLDQMDPPLREYYRHLRLVTSGPIFSWKRLCTIADLELGRYDHLLQQWQTCADARGVLGPGY